MKRIYIDPDECVGCGQCVEICENINVSGKYSSEIDESSCTLCGTCLEFDCLGDAIKMEV